MHIHVLCISDKEYFLRLKSKLGRIRLSPWRGFLPWAGIVWHCRCALHYCWMWQMQKYIEYKKQGIICDVRLTRNSNHYLLLLSCDMMFGSIYVYGRIMQYYKWSLMIHNWSWIVKYNTFHSDNITKTLIYIFYLHLLGTLLVTASVIRVSKAQMSKESFLAYLERQAMLQFCQMGPCQLWRHQMNAQITLQPPFWHRVWRQETVSRSSGFLFHQSTLNDTNFRP